MATVAKCYQGKRSCHEVFIYKSSWIQCLGQLEWWDSYLQDLSLFIEWTSNTSRAPSWFHWRIRLDFLPIWSRSKLAAFLYIPSGWYYSNRVEKINNKQWQSWSQNHWDNSCWDTIPELHLAKRDHATEPCVAWFKQGFWRSLMVCRTNQEDLYWYSLQFRQNRRRSN